MGLGLAYGVVLGLGLMGLGLCLGLGVELVFGFWVTVGSCGWVLGVGVEVRGWVLWLGIQYGVAVGIV